MRILLTNISMASRSGTEIATAELAFKLRSRGHEVVIYAHLCGELASVLRTSGTVVVDKINQVPFVPEVIHGHHNITLAIALIHFPQVPAIFVCHDFDAWHDKPFLHPKIKHYVSVDELCLKRLLINEIPPEYCCVINNAVGTDKFAKKTSFKDTPKKALLLSKGSAHASLVSQVCRELDIEIDCIGPGFNQTIDNLHEVLGNYDIVFATARMALEALCCGCCVIVCDHRGFAGTVTTGNWSHWYAWNLGRGLLDKDVTRENLIAAIQQYSVSNILQLTDQVRQDAAIEVAVAKYESLYHEILAADQGAMGDAGVQTINTTLLNQPGYNLAAFLEDHLPSYNSNTSWYDIGKRLIVEANSGVNAEIQHINQNLIRIQEDTDSIRRDIGFVRLITRFLRVFYTPLKQLLQMSGKRLRQ